MIQGKPGLDVSSLVRGVLAESGNDVRRLRGAPEPALRVMQGSRLAHRLSSMVGVAAGTNEGDAYGRLFGTSTGISAVKAVGNESRTLDLLSSLSIEVLLEYLDQRWGFTREQG